VPEFAHPWLWLALPLPLLVLYRRPAPAPQHGAVRIPRFALIAELAGATGGEGNGGVRQPAAIALAALAWIALVCGLAGPQRPGERIETTRAARDVMLAIDISGSMMRRDFRTRGGQRIERLELLKRVLRRFINARSGDRVGLIVFGSKAYLQSPFTGDTAAARRLLDAVEAGMAGPQTVIGDALGLAIRAFEASELEQRLLILLTDGSDTGSRMSPLNAARIAARHGIEVITIGIGDPATTGEDRVDFSSLREIARLTGGRFFTAADEATLVRVYERINELTPRVAQSVSHRPLRSLAHWPALAAALAGLALLALQASGRPD